MDRGKLPPPQIDPRGSAGAGILAIRSYGVGYTGRNLDILMLNKKGALIGPGKRGICTFGPGKRVSGVIRPR